MKNAYFFQRLALRRNKFFLTFFRLLPVMMLALLLTGSGVNAWGAQGDLIYSLDLAAQNSAFGTSNAYGAKSGTVSGVTWYANAASCQSTALVWLGTNSATNRTSLTILSAGVNNRGGAIATALGITTSTVGYYALVGSNPINNVGSIKVKAATTGGTTPSTLWCLYTTDGGTTYTVLGSVSTPGTTEQTFTPVSTIASAQYAFVFYSNAFGTYRTPYFKFYEGSSGSISPTLTAASSPTVDAAFDVTFTEDASWRGAITEITVGGTTLAASAYDKTAAGKITFTPSASALLQSAGTKAIVVKATGYSDATVSQAIGAGVAAALTMKTQPAAPSTNGAVLATQPEVNVLDQYGNITTATVVASKGDAGAWTLGGTTSVAAISGVSTFTNLTATSAAAVTGASLTFTSGALTVNSAAFDIAAPPAQIDWTNLQWPGTGAVKLGQAYDVYARVYEPGVTDAVGQGAGVQVWIGYSTSATNPNTWTNWVAATYYGDDGANNDEYKANLGAVMTAAGTYYYATRVQLGTALYVYGGFNGGFWDGTTNVSGVLTVNPAETLDWVNLQAPASGDITTAQTLDVYAQVYEPGVTPGVGQGAGIQAWIGYSTANDNPATGTGWTWVSASHNVAVTGNNDEYKATLSGLSAGTYYYASRFKYGLADYQYGGLTGAWVADQSGVLTVTTAEPADHVTNFAAATTAPTHSSIKLDWTDAVGASHYLIKGSAVSYEDITTPVDLSSEVDGALVKNVAAAGTGAGSHTFTGLTGETAYFFKIFPYNGTGTVVNFKTDGTVPQASATTTKTPTLLLAEDFDYANEALLTANGWKAHSGAGTQAIDVAVPGLSFNGYVGSGIGGAAKVDNTGEDLNKAFSAQTSGSIYAAFVISASATNATGYFFHLANDNAAGTTFISRVWVNGSGTGVGIGANAPSTYFPIVANTPTLLVVKYNFATKVSSLYVLNTMSATEPATADATFTETADITNLGTVCLRQYNASQNILVDGIRVTTRWADLPVSFSGTGEWTESARWNTGAVPGTTAQVVVDGAATINSDVEVAGLTINAGKSLTVNPAKQLTITGTATNNGTITIQSDANGTGTIVGNVSGAATVNQYLKGDYRTWYLSSPVANAQPANLGWIKYYNEADGSWPTLFDARTSSAVAYGSNSFVTAKGYLVVPSTSAVANANIQFVGELNTGNKSIALTNSVTNTSKPGFNLVGNPYPSYLKWADVYAANSSKLSSASIWYRTKQLNELSQLEYVFWTVNGDGVVTPLGVSASSNIPPMQAFWVKTTAGGGTLELTNNMRSHANATGFLLKAPAVDTRTLIRLQVSNGTNTDEAVLYLSDNANNGLDAFDAPKMSNDNASIAEIFTRAGNEKLVINAMRTLPRDTEIALGFEAGSATSFTLRANELSNLPSDVQLILKDNVTKAETDLTDGTAVYSFSNIATSGDRFSIIFRTAGAVTGIDQPTFSGLTAYSNANNQLTVLYDGVIDAHTVVSVYNAVGQRLVTQSLKGASTIVDGAFTPGVYVVKVNNLSRKLTIKN